MDDNTESSKRQRRISIITCVIVSPVIFFLFYSWHWLAGASIALMSNAIIVNFTYRHSTNQEKIRLWIRASSITFLLVLGLYLLIGGIYFLALLFGKKMGG